MLKRFILTALLVTLVGCSDVAVNFIGGKALTLTSTATAQSLSGVNYPASNRAYAYGQSGKILFSSDGGATWVNQSSGTSNYLFGGAFPSGSVGTLVGGDPVAGAQTILHTINSGSGWVFQAGGSPYPLLQASFADANNGWVVGYGGTIAHTTNGGASWNSQVTGILTTLNGVSAVTSSLCYIVGDYGVAIKTTNGGSTWSTLTTGTNNDLYACKAVTASKLTAVGLAGTIIYTSNGGSSFSGQTSGTTNNLYGVSFADTVDGFIAGQGGTILHTTNAGSNWSSQSIAIANWADVSALTKDTALIVGDRNYYIYKTVNAGSAWIQVNPAATTIPAPPTMTWPTNNASNVPTTVTFTWTASSGATSYHLQVSVDRTFASIYNDQNGLSGTSSNPVSLAAGTTYYAQVQASNSAGSSSFSAIDSFATASVASSPAFAVNPTSLNFGKVPKSSVNKKSFVVSNTGGDSLRISRTVISNSAYTVSDTAYVVAPSGTKTVTVTFTPTVKNTTYSGSILMYHNAAGSPGSVSVVGKSGAR